MGVEMKELIILIAIALFFLGIVISRGVFKYERERNQKCSDYCLEFTGDNSYFLTSSYCCCDKDSPLRNGSFQSEYCIPIEILMRLRE